MEASLLRVPVVQDNNNWTCRIWVRNALAQLVTDSILGTKVTDWSIIEKECIAYVERKKKEGRFQKSPMPESVPTFDLLEMKETAI